MRKVGTEAGLTGDEEELEDEEGGLTSDEEEL